VSPAARAAGAENFLIGLKIRGWGDLLVPVGSRDTQIMAEGPRKSPKWGGKTRKIAKMGRIWKILRGF